MSPVYDASQNVPRNLKVLDDPDTGGIYIGTDTMIIPLMADAPPGTWAYWGPAAGWYLYSSPAADATLIEQARGLAAEAQRGAAAEGIDFRYPSHNRFVPYNWATYYIGQNEGQRWVPLNAAGSFVAPVAGQYAGYFGLDPNDPIMVLSQGYTATIGPVQPGPPELFGWPSVTVTYQRTGAVPPPQGPGQPVDPSSIPNYRDVLIWAAAKTAAPSLVHAALSAGATPQQIASAPPAVYRPIVDEPVYANDQNSMGAVLVGAGATIAGSPSGSDLPVSGTAATVVTDTGLAIVPPVAPNPLSGIMQLLTGAPQPMGAPAAAGGLSGMLPLLLLGGLVILAARK